MARHEKHAHAANRQGQESKVQSEATDYEQLDELEGSAELLKSSFTAGNEMKIAVGVIGVLLVIFAAAMVKWMRHSSSPVPAPAEEAALKNGDKKIAAGDKDAGEPRERSPFGAANRSNESKVVAAMPGPDGESRPKSRAGEPDNWPSGSDGKLKPLKAADERQSPPSFKSRNPGDLARGDGRPSQGGWGTDTGAAGKTAGAPPSDPFRSRAAVDGLRRDPAGTAAAAPPATGTSSADGLRGALRTGSGMAPSTPSRAPDAPIGSNPLRFPDVSSAAPASGSTSPNRLASTTADRSLASGVAPGRRNDGTYVVQLNDNYWSISTALYGSGVYYQALAKANSKKREESLRPGDVIAAPTVSELQNRYPDLCPNAARRDAVDTRPRTVSAPSVPGSGKTYVVQQGDNIYELARQELGKASRWREIYDLNKDVLGTRSLELTPGTRLVLPDASSATLSQRNDSGQLR